MGQASNLKVLQVLLGIFWHMLLGYCQRVTQRLCIVCVYNWQLAGLC
jgi:hypothetical protein